MYQELVKDHLSRYLDVLITRPGPRDHEVIRTQHETNILSYVAKMITEHFANEFELSNMFIVVGRAICGLAANYNAV